MQIGFVKGKSAIQIHRRYLGRKQNFTGFYFWSRGYCVSTVGGDEQKIREYIKKLGVGRATSRSCATEFA